MNVATELSGGASGNRSPAATDRVGRLFRIVGLIAAAVLLICAIMVVPGWIPLLPRGTRRALTEGFLHVVLAAYTTLFLVSAVGLPVMAFLLLKCRAARRSRPLLARGVLLGSSCLFSLVMLELGSTCWRSWMHRYPALPLTLPAPPANEFPIVVLGGSSAMGEPYRPWISVGQIVSWKLGEAMPDRRFECQVLAFLGDSLEDQHRKLASLTRRPGMIIIYSGHNEFTSRYEEERDGWLDEEPGSPVIQPVYRASTLSPFCRLAYELISKNRLDVGPSMAGRHQLIDSPQCSPAEAKEIYADFERRLETLTAYTEQIGAVPVLIIPPANEADYEPSRSTLPTSVRNDQRRALERDISEARATELTDARESTERYRRILDRNPGFAEAHFRLARLEERAGLHDSAARHYLAALENDGLPIRCTAPLRGAYERVAARHPRSILIDGRRVLAEASPRKLLDDHVIQDTHHPTLLGQAALAEALLRELTRKEVFGAAYRFDRPLDPAACAAHFEMNAEKWATMCDRTSEHYRRVAGYRFDPAQRLEKSRRYAEAARQIRAGVAPARLGIPGVGVRGPAGQGTLPAASFLHLFDLPVLQHDGCSSAQESHGCREMVSVGALDHFAGESRERTIHNPHRGADGHARLFRDREPRADHGIDLMKVADERILIGDFENAREAVPAKRRDAIFGRSPQEHVAGKEGNDRLESPALRSAAFFFCLGQVVRKSRRAQLARDCLLLPGLRVQAPPDRTAVQSRRRSVFPEVCGVTVGLGRKNGHRLIGSGYLAGQPGTLALPGFSGASLPEANLSPSCLSVKRG